MHSTVFQTSKKTSEARTQNNFCGTSRVCSQLKLQTAILLKYNNEYKHQNNTLRIHSRNQNIGPKTQQNPIPERNYIKSKKIIYQNFQNYLAEFDMAGPQAQEAQCDGHDDDGEAEQNRHFL